MNSFVTQESYFTPFIWFSPRRLSHIIKARILSQSNKLEDGDGFWEYRKVILGWIFDGLSRCVSLPQITIDKMMVEM